MPLKVLHTLPIIKGMTGIAKTMGNMFQLLQVQAEVCKQRQLTCINGSQGYSAETSGGLLMSISAEGAKTFAEEILAIEGQPAWVIGTVEVVNNMVIGSHSFLLDDVHFYLNTFLSWILTLCSGWKWKGENRGQSNDYRSVAGLLKYDLIKIADLASVH